MTELPPPPCSPGVRNGGGICLKRHFIIIKSIFTKPLLVSTWDLGLEGRVILGSGLENSEVTFQGDGGKTHEWQEDQGTLEFL